MKNEKIRYNKTNCIEKRSIVRSLNTFSKQYKYISIDSKAKKEFILSKVNPLNLYFLNSKEEYLYDEENIIYNEEEAIIDILSEQKIKEQIDNLLSINTKIDLKKKLKKIVESRQVGPKNTFLINPDLTILAIMEILQDDIKDKELFATRLFNQIKNRVLYYRSGIYSTSYNISNVKNQIKLSPTSIKAIEEKYVKHLLDLKELLLLLEKLEDKKEKIEDEKEKIEDKKEKIEDEKESIEDELESHGWNSDNIEILKRKNFSLLHPVNEEDFNSGEDTTLGGINAYDILNNYTTENYDDLIENFLDYETLENLEEQLEKTEEQLENLENDLAQLEKQLEDLDDKKNNCIFILKDLTKYIYLIYDLMLMKEYKNIKDLIGDYIFSLAIEDKKEVLKAIEKTLSKEFRKIPFYTKNFPNKKLLIWLLVNLDVLEEQLDIVIPNTLIDTTKETNNALLIEDEGEDEIPW